MRVAHRGSCASPDAIFGSHRGGTTDFSLIAVTDNNSALELDRISVGEHILLGGDNMDQALAYTLQAQLEAEGKSICTARACCWAVLGLGIVGAAAALVFLPHSLPVVLPSVALH